MIGRRERRWPRSRIRRGRDTIRATPARERVGVRSAAAAPRRPRERPDDVRPLPRMAVQPSTSPPRPARRSRRTRDSSATIQAAAHTGLAARAMVVMGGWAQGTARCHDGNDECSSAASIRSGRQPSWLPGHSSTRPHSAPHHRRARVRTPSQSNRLRLTWRCPHTLEAHRGHCPCTRLNREDGSGSHHSPPSPLEPPVAPS